MCARMGISVGGQRGGGCSLKLVNSTVYVNRASNNPGSPPWLLMEYKGHHKSTSSRTFSGYHASSLSWETSVHDNFCLGTVSRRLGLCCDKFQVH